MKYLLEICEFLAVPGTSPQRFVAHRWLSAYDVGINTRRMLPAYKVLYVGFLSQADQTLYQEVLEEIFKEATLLEITPLTFIAMQMIRSYIYRSNPMKLINYLNYNYVLRTSNPG